MLSIATSSLSLDKRKRNKIKREQKKTLIYILYHLLIILLKRGKETSSIDGRMNVKT